VSNEQQEFLEHEFAPRPLRPVVRLGAPLEKKERQSSVLFAHDHAEAETDPLAALDTDAARNLRGWE